MILNDSIIRVIESYLNGSETVKVILSRQYDKVEIFIEYTDKKHTIYVEKDKYLKKNT